MLQVGPRPSYHYLPQMNMADPTDNQWCSCFQETAEKVLGVKAEELGRSGGLETVQS